jgi:hypothetical protein
MREQKKDCLQDSRYFAACSPDRMVEKHPEWRYFHRLEGFDSGCFSPSLKQ